MKDKKLMLKGYWVILRGLLFALVLLPECVAAQVQPAGREEAHQYASKGFKALSYKDTYDALAYVHENVSDSTTITLFYSRIKQAKFNRLTTGRSGPDHWNREHLWPQSLGTKKQPMKSDLHALRPADNTVNSRRSNLMFATDGKADPEVKDAFYDADSYEPPDIVKGDVARALFYMDLRYEGTNLEPNLELRTGSAAAENTMGHLCTLLDWHELDPVSDEESFQHERIIELQGNRNPFIDFEGLANNIYGNLCLSTFSR